MLAQSACLLVQQQYVVFVVSCGFGDCFITAVAYSLDCITMYQVPVPVRTAAVLLLKYVYLLFISRRSSGYQASRARTLGTGGTQPFRPPGSLRTEDW